MGKVTTPKGGTMGELALQRNDFNPAAISAGTAVEQSRAVAETQAAMAVAQARPRDEYRAYTQIMKACDRQSLAATSMYAYKRGGSMVEGPSIRLAEVIARHWGNITYGLRELSRVEGESEIEAFAWDLESNTRVTRQFVLRHTRDKKGGGVALTEERDIYELAANMGQRRVRACLLELIPGDIVEEAVDRCKKTLVKGDEPLADRIRKMVLAFGSLGVTKVMIEEYLTHKVEAIVPAQMVKLTQIYSSITSGVATQEEFFNLQASDLNNRFKAPKEEPPPVEAPPPTDPPAEEKKPGKLDEKEFDKIRKTLSSIKSSLALDKWRATNHKRLENTLNDITLGAVYDYADALYQSLTEQENNGAQ